MILTVLEARVPAERADTLRSEYAKLAQGTRPPGFVRSQLIRDAQDPAAWRIETLWESREALEAMRQRGTPAGLLLFRAIGVEPTVGVFEVVATVDR